MRRLRRLRPATPSLSGAVHHTFLALTVGVVLAAIYRYCWLEARDPFKCAAVLNQGQWLDGSPDSYRPPHFQNWQPPGCMMHEYTGKDITRCLASKRLVFAGDSTPRQIFWAVAKKLDAGKADMTKANADKHSDLVFESGEVSVEYIWDPFLNSSRLQDELAAFEVDPHSEESQSAAVILAGGGLWFARYFEVNPLKEFKESIDAIMPYMIEASRNSSSVAAARPTGSSNSLILAPVQVPWYDSLSPSRKATLTPEKIDNMNDYLQQLSAFQGADVAWSYSTMTAQLKPTYEESGLHVIEPVAVRMADVLLNLRCNADAAETSGQGYPYDRTCCSNYGHPGWVQSSGLLLGLAGLPALILSTSSEQNRGRMMPPTKVVRAFLVFTLIICYCFYTDRTQLFNKLRQRFSFEDFGSLCWVTLGLGVLSIRRSTSPQPRRSEAIPSSSAPSQPFLSRDQTDEWKGWMQFVILIYHYTGASHVLWIYQIVRLLVASYLFMTGFGHTVYFYTTGDYSLRRVASVLVRLNLLSCALAYMMRTDYLFYYFSPLVSFWFMVIYFTMKVGRTRNGVLPFLLGKIVASAILVTGLTKIPGILELIFATLRFTCRIHWDLKEWRFRAFLDMYIVYVGMICAILFVEISNQSSPARRSFLSNRRIMASINILSVVAAMIILPGFWALTRRSPDKADYNWWHPCISFLPIISFAVLRNSHRHLRNFRSSIFVWLGQRSLETFTLQFHIWLAGDRKGLLSLNMTGRLLEFLILTAVFVWLSHLISGTTSVITSFIVDGGRPSPQSRGKSSSDEHYENHSRGLPNGHCHGDAHRDHQIFLGNDDEDDDDHGAIPGTTSSKQFSGWIGIFTNKWRESLENRMYFLLFLMWFLNVTYT
ncbi:MAG: hypothetical protein M1837_000034 [Sclerophora amabilis]|nr:MAG: hypothetical protein M1837_000034 [Sclerophora amabilis]